MIKGQLVKRELAYHFGGYPLCRRLSRFYVTFNNPGKIQKLEFNSVNDRLSSDSFDFFFFFPSGNLIWLHFLKYLCPKLNNIPFQVASSDLDNGDEHVYKCDVNVSWHSSPIHPSPPSTVMELSWAHGCLVENQISSPPCYRVWLWDSALPSRMWVEGM